MDPPHRGVTDDAPPTAGAPPPPPPRLWWTRLVVLSIFGAFALAGITRRLRLAYELLSRAATSTAAR